MVPGPRLSRWLARWLAIPASLLSLGAVTAALAGPPHQPGTDPIILEGSVVVIRGNQLPGPRREAPTPAQACTVVAVAGAVMPLQPGQALLPSQALKAPILARARCNRQGRFRLSVPPVARWPGGYRGPDQLTLMLQVPGGYYLNLFDGRGQFASFALPLALNPTPITLMDDRDALH